ncbi:MAG TPA: hypothetical protein VI217_21015 [Mycobacterium sp.]
MSVRVRWSLVASIGVLAGVAMYVASVARGTGAGDMAWPLQAARDIIAGHDPYVQPVTVDDAGNQWPTNPVTTAMPFLPFTWAPDAVIAAVFFGAMSALLAYGLTKEGKLWPLLTFASPAYVACVVYAQWAPLILATYYLPQLLPLALVKPSIALPVLLTRLNLKRALACAAVIAATFILCPWWWPPDWLVPSMKVYSGFTPILTLPGILVLLALIRWRDRRAWILVIAALVPQRIVYDQLILWLVPQNAKRSLLLSASLVAAYGVRKLTGWDTEMLIVVFLYLPCVVFVIWPPSRDAPSSEEQQLQPKTSAA